MKSIRIHKLGPIVLPLFLTINPGFASAEPALRVTGEVVRSNVIEGQVPASAQVSRSSQGRYRAEIQLISDLAKRAIVGSHTRIRLPFVSNPQLLLPLQRTDQGKLYVEFSYPHSAVLGMKLELRLAIRKTSAFEIPINSIFSPNPNQQHVFVARDGVTAKVPIRVWSLDKGRVLVFAEGLRPEDVVLTAKLNQVTQGQKVQVLQ